MMAFCLYHRLRALVKMLKIYLHDSVQYLHGIGIQCGRCKTRPGDGGHDESPQRRASLAGSLDPVALALAPESGGVDAEAGGGFFQRSGVGQDLLDVAPFQLF